MEQNRTIKNFTFTGCTAGKGSVCTNIFSCCVTVDYFPHTQSFQKVLLPITLQQICIDVTQKKFWFERNDGLQKVFSENRTQGLAGSAMDEKQRSAIVTCTNDCEDPICFFSNINIRRSTRKHCQIIRGYLWFPEEIRTVKIVSWH